VPTLTQKVPAFEGSDDRFSIGRREVAEGGMLRLSMLEELEIVPPPERKHNSERSLQAQLEFLGIHSRALPLRFCTLSQRSYPGGVWKDVPALDIGSTAPLSGAKCRPCNPVLTGQEAIAALQKCSPSHGLPYDPPRKADGSLHLCNATLPWPSDWEDLFDSKAGQGAAS